MMRGEERKGKRRGLEGDVEIESVKKKEPEPQSETA